MTCWMMHLDPDTKEKINIDALGKEYKRRINKEQSEGSPYSVALRTARKQMLAKLKEKGVKNSEAVYLLHHVK